MSKVSVVIPVYNGATTISETIESLLEQTFKDLEILVIDDGSTDNTVEVVRQFDDFRIKTLSFENGGLPVARNRGIENATGDYISFIDADDLWAKDKIERQIAAIESHPDAGVAYSWTTFIDENSDFLYAREPLHYEGDVYPDLLVRNFISNGSNILIKKSVVDKVGYFDASLKSVEDWEYYLRLAAHCHFAVVKDHQIFYRKTAQAMSKSIPRMEHYGLLVINRAFDAAPPQLQHLKPKSLSNLYRYLTKQCVGEGYQRADLSVGLSKMRQSLRLYPRSIMERETQRLLTKLLVLNFLPVSYAKSFVKALGKRFPMVPY